MVHVTSGGLALPVPDDSDPMEQLPQTIRDMAVQLETSGNPVPIGYTGTLEAGGSSVNLGAGSDSRAYYYALGSDLIHLVIWVRVGGAGLSIPGGVWTFALPYIANQPDPSSDPIQYGGVLTLYDNSNGDVYRGLAKVRATDPTTLACFVDGTTAGGPMRNMSGTVPFTLANNDQLALSLTYSREIS